MSEGLQVRSPARDRSRRRRYQVFVSSTYIDLETERQQVLNVLLSLGCFPAGMEYFPATNATAWEYVSQVIAESDFYVVIVGGRYGSVDDRGVSFTEREYDLATDLGIPTMAFLHGEPGAIRLDRSELDSDARQRLDAFRAKLETAHLRRTWTTPDNLATAVSVSLSAAIHEGEATGWVPADAVADGDHRLWQFAQERVREVLTLQPGTGFESLVEMDLRAIDNGAEMIYQEAQPDGSSRLEAIAGLDGTCTVLSPPIARGQVERYFVHVGRRQHARGELATIRFRETWREDVRDSWYVHNYEVIVPLRHLELVAVFPAEERPARMSWRRTVGQSEHIIAGDLLDYDDAERTRVTLSIPSPQVGSNYGIAWEY